MKIKPINPSKIIREKGIDNKSVLIIIFIISTLFRFFMSVKTGTINIIYDELIYWDISESILADGSTLFRNLLVSNKDLIYPIMIMWTQVLNSFNNIYVAILLMNAVMMSSVVFPTYKLAEIFFENKKISWIIAIVSVLVPEMFYTTRIIQENVYYPMAMWAFYFFAKYIVTDKFNVKRVGLFSIYICILTHVKMIGLCLLGGAIFFYGIQILDINNKKDRIRSVLMSIEMVMIYLFGKTIVGWFIERTLMQSTGDSVASLTGSALNNLLNFENLVGYVYPIMSYIVFCGLFLGLFTVIVPIAYYRELDRKSKDLLIFTVGVVMITVGVICLLILNADNEVGQRVTRIHFRYLFYTYMPFLILFIKNFEILKNKGVKWQIFLLCAIYIICVIITVPQIGVGSEIDSIPANSLQAFFMTSQRQRLFKIIVISSVIMGCWLIYKKYIKILYTCVFIVLICLSVHSTQKAYRISYGEKLVLSNYQMDGEVLSDYLRNKIDGIDDTLIVAYNKASSGVMEVSLDIPYRVCVMDEFVNSNISNKEDISCDQLKFYHIDSYQLTSYENPEYIISQGQMELSKYQLIDIGLNNFYLYQKIMK